MISFHQSKNMAAINATKYYDTTEFANANISSVSSAIPRNFPVNQYGVITTNEIFNRQPVDFICQRTTAPKNFYLNPQMYSFISNNIEMVPASKLILFPETSVNTTCQEGTKSKISITSNQLRYSSLPNTPKIILNSELDISPIPSIGSSSQINMSQNINGSIDKKLQFLNKCVETVPNQEHNLFCKTAIGVTFQKTSKLKDTAETGCQPIYSSIFEDTSTMSVTELDSFSSPLNNSTCKNTVGSDGIIASLREEMSFLECEDFSADIAAEFDFFSELSIDEIVGELPSSLMSVDLDTVTATELTSLPSSCTNTTSERIIESKKELINTNQQTNTLISGDSEMTLISELDSFPTFSFDDFQEIIESENALRITDEEIFAMMSKYDVTVPTTKLDLFCNSLKNAAATNDLTHGVISNHIETVPTTAFNSLVTNNKDTKLVPNTKIDPISTMLNINSCEKNVESRNGMMTAGPEMYFFIDNKTKTLSATQFGSVSSPSKTNILKSVKTRKSTKGRLLSSLRAKCKNAKPSTKLNFKQSIDAISGKIRGSNNIDDKNTVLNTELNSFSLASNIDQRHTESKNTATTSNRLMYSLISKEIKMVPGTESNSFTQPSIDVTHSRSTSNKNVNNHIGQQVYSFVLDDIKTVPSEELNYISRAPNSANGEGATESKNTVTTSGQTNSMLSLTVPAAEFSSYYKSSAVAIHAKPSELKNTMITTKSDARNVVSNSKEKCLLNSQNNIKNSQINISSTTEKPVILVPLQIYNLTQQNNFSANKNYSLSNAKINSSRYPSSVFSPSEHGPKLITTVDTKTGTKNVKTTKRRNIFRRNSKLGPRLHKLIIHLKNYFKGNKCLLCGFEIKSKKAEQARKHLLWHLDNKEFNCNDCKESFSEPKLLLQHRAVHSSEYSFACDECGIKFRNEENLWYHKKRHVKKHTCSVCNNEYSTIKSLKEHLTEHPGAKPYECLECNETFQTAGLLKVHCRNIHKLYNCTVCNIGYNKKSLLVDHMNYHKDSASHKCKICVKVFNFKSNLEQHMWSHTYARRHVCEICEMKFKFPADLRNHMAMHNE